MIYGLTDMVMMAIFAGLAAGMFSGLIVDAWHRRQPQPQPQPPAPALAAEALEAAAKAGAEIDKVRETLRLANDAIAQMRRSAHAYKELAETLEASLATARSEAAEAQALAAEIKGNHAKALEYWNESKKREAFWRERAEVLSRCYQQRTAEALAAGFTIVFDHGNPRRHHPQREDPEQ